MNEYTVQVYNSERVILTLTAKGNDIDSALASIIPVARANPNVISAEGSLMITATNNQDTSETMTQLL